MMIPTSDFKNGISIVLNNTLYQIISFQHIKPGKGGAFVRTKLKNMRTKNVTDKTFRAGEKVEQAFIETKKIQFMYNSGDRYFFMDTATFEELSLPGEILGDKKRFLNDGMEITALFHKHTIIDLTPPLFIKLKVRSVEPGFRGDTARAAYKPASMENGTIIQVPLFIKNGDIIKIDTRTGEYVERA